MAGYPAVSTIAELQKLRSDERQNLLCRVCSMYSEIACTGRDHGNEVLTLLASECPLFIDGFATCHLEAYSIGQQNSR
jgi:hypothetical protein